MKKGRIISALIVLLVLAMPFVMAATIHGRVYDYSFRLVDNAYVTINTAPEQLMITRDGSYSFVVSKGSYNIQAYTRSGGELVSYAELNITIGSEGDYVRDIVLFPEEDLDELDINESLDEAIDPVEDDEMPLAARLGISILLLLALAVIVWLALRSKVEKKDVLGIDFADQEDDELKKVADFIRSRKRVTQKDIRANFSMSEAKISLIISELEEKGVIRKFKKGRGNVIVFEKKK